MDYQVGDRVNHVGSRPGQGRGPGTVTEVELDGTVHVEFDRIGEKSKRQVTGIYDANWFRQNGYLLQSHTD